MLMGAVRPGGAAPAALLQAAAIQQANALLENLPIARRILLGDFLFSPELIQDFLTWVDAGGIYAGSDGSVEGGDGAHSFVFTSNRERERQYGVALPQLQVIPKIWHPNALSMQGQLQF